LNFNYIRTIFSRVDKVEYRSIELLYSSWRKCAKHQVDTRPFRKRCQL